MSTEQAARTPPQPVTGPVLPVTLLTGFLGAGKTTLLRRVLDAVGPQRICVVENELGAANIDSEILEMLAPGVVRRINGCICCAVTTDLVSTFRALPALCAERGVERIVVETTGMAEPAELLPLFGAGGPLSDVFRLASTVTVCDAAHVALDLENSPVAQSQVAVADLLVVNKADLVAPAALERAIAAIRTVNPLAAMHVGQGGDCPPERVLADALAGLRFFTPPGRHSHGGVAATLLVEPGPHDLRRLLGALRGLARRRPLDLLRVKGVVHASDGRRVLIQGVRERFAWEPLGRFPPGAAPETQLVVIGIELGPDDLDSLLPGSRRTPPTC